MLDGRSGMKLRLEDCLPFVSASLVYQGQQLPLKNVLLRYWLAVGAFVDLATLTIRRGETLPV